MNDQPQNNNRITSIDNKMNEKLIELVASQNTMISREVSRNTLVTFCMIVIFLLFGSFMGFRLYSLEGQVRRTNYVVQDLTKALPAHKGNTTNATETTLP